MDAAQIDVAVEMLHRLSADADEKMEAALNAIWSARAELDQIEAALRAVAGGATEQRVGIVHGLQAEAVFAAFTAAETEKSMWDRLLGEGIGVEVVDEPVASRKA